ncbi:MAG: multiprotein bridging factor aMBF1 [Candidatus Micrarchaeia archaeon]
MDCEMCGAGEAEYLIQVEGAKMNVCRDCSGTGKIIRYPTQASRNADQGGSQGAPIVRREMEVVDGYGALIQSARKKLGLPIEVLAEKINEKLSFLERIEHQKTLPDEKIAKKLEKELGIVLLQEVAMSDTPGDTRKGAPVTLGDIIEIEKRERKKKG